MVRQDQRTKSRFELADKALDLATYTIDITHNEKIFDPKYQRVIDEIVYYATVIYHSIRVANDINVKGGEKRKAEARTKLQYDALDCIEPLKSDIMIAKKLFHLKTKRVCYWTSQVDTIKEMLSGWIQSDKEKYRKLGM